MDCGWGGGRRGKRTGRRLTPLEAWAQSVAAGIPDDLYWQCTPPERQALLEALAQREERRERSATLRAGLVAAAVYNVHRKKGAKAIKPQDFVRQEKKTEIVSPEEFARRMSAWADSHNAKVAKA